MSTHGSPAERAPRIELIGDESLLVEWEDGHQSRYEGARLRALCPCASCKEDRGPKSPLAVLRPFRPNAARILRVQAVGRYAVAPVFGDQHATGIYSWDYLRRHCDCLACRLGRREDQEREGE